MKKQLLALVVAAIALTASDALAQTSANIAVTAKVNPSCTIAVTALSFPDYDPISAAAVPATGGITLTCTKSTLYTVRLGPGNSASFPRAMTGNVLGTKLQYEIYKELSHTNVWGDGTGGTTGFSGTAASKAPFTLTMYGLIAANQDADQDDYADTVAASVTF